uniref:Uncharacterized protein n=1 Tax=Octopus bimaculoides TaxID=37653 RepID=A0A0L8HN52_OCTBM
MGTPFSEIREYFVDSSHAKTYIDMYVRTNREAFPCIYIYHYKNLFRVYAVHEREKRCCNERVLQIEKCSFTPIVMSASRRMREEANKHHKRIALLIAEKQNERYSDVP